MRKSRKYQLKEIEITYESAIDLLERPIVNSSQVAHQIFRACWNHSRIELFEEAKVLFVNRQMRVLALYHLNKGTTYSTTIDVKRLLMAALKINAFAIFLAHNHPSGNLKASHADIAISEKLSEATKFMDIQLLDHLIITRRGYLSMADEGLL